MLDPDGAVNCLPLLYRSYTVRIHKSTVNAKVYFVLSDICKVLQISNPSYVAKRINKNYTHKHKLSNSNGRNVATWVNYDGLVQLFDTLPRTVDLAVFWVWCRGVSRRYVE